MSLCRKLQSVTKLFRCLEILAAVAFITWLTTRLPFAVRLSGEYFRRLSAVVLSPPSIFLLGNAIVLSLLAKSGLLSSSATAATTSVDNAVADLYAALRPGADDPPLAEDVVFQDKEMILCDDKEKKKEKETPEVVKERKYERSKSERGMVVRRESGVEEKLRRTKTAVAEEEGEGMSSDEFRQTIEAFIAKQVMFHRQERLAVVLHGKA